MVIDTMNKRIFIFDVDGTLVDTARLHADAWAYAFQKSGVGIDEEGMLPYIGMGSAEIIKDLMGDDVSQEKIAGVKAVYRERYKEKEPEIKGFPKVKELFQELKNQEKLIVLASSTRKEYIRKYMDIIGVDGLVDEILGFSDFTKSKPNPEIFQKALEKVEGTPEEALVIGDARWDIEAATRLGVDSIGVLSGATSEDTLKQAGAKEVYPSVTEIYEAIKD